MEGFKWKRFKEYDQDCRDMENKLYSSVHGTRNIILLYIAEQLNRIADSLEDKNANN